MHRLGSRMQGLVVLGLALAVLAVAGCGKPAGEGQGGGAQTQAPGGDTARPVTVRG